jgi:hypothetical protein
MSFLSALPKELLLGILSYLLSLSIEALAQTFSYNVTPTCLPSFDIAQPCTKQYATASMRKAEAREYEVHAQLRDISHTHTLSAK